MLTSPVDRAGRTSRRTALIAAAVLTTGLSASAGGVVLADDARAAGAAATGTITYIQGNNVFVAAQDGSSPRQVTTDGTVASPYYSPTESDDGHIVAGKGELIYRMDQWGYVLNTIDPPDLRSGGGETRGGAPVDLSVSPDGTKVAFSYIPDYCSGGGYCHIWPVTGFIDSTGANPSSTFGTTFGRNPSWVNNTRVVLDSLGPFDNIYLYDLGRGGVHSSGWFDDDNIHGPGYTNVADIEISRGTTYAVGIRGYLDQATTVFLTLDGLGDLDAGFPAVPDTSSWLCQTTAQLGQSNPTWSADGSIAAWQEPDGVWAVAMGEAPCDSGPTLMKPGASEPSFSPAAMQTTRPTYPPPPGPTTPVPTTTAPSPTPQSPTVTPTFTVKAAPKVAGKARVGARLKATGSTMVPKPTTVRYQWTRDKKAIKGATKSTYQVTRKDRKHQLAVRVTGIRPGFKTVVSVSKAVRVKR
jgi:hypothetical protein